MKSSETYMTILNCLKTTDMKTIEEATREFQRDYQTDIEERAVHSAFKSGFEFAHRWIDVKDELPEKGIKLLVLLNDNEIQFDKWVNYWYVWRITHWRPIEWK